MLNAQDNRLAALLSMAFLGLAFPPAMAQGSTPPPRKMEKLNRGLIAVPSGGGCHLSWRLFGTEPQATAFNVYKGTTRLNSAPITATTTYQDNAACSGAYTVKPVLNGTELEASEPARIFSTSYHAVRVNTPANYTPNDASVADLDGDGEYEIILKMEPNDAKDNAQDGVTSKVFIDAYKLDGTRLWRIDLGRNIRAGAHYTQFMVYDLDGDGRAEVALKTADGTVDGLGKVIGNANANHVNSAGRILTGSEFFTLFDGKTGGALATVDYVPGRGNVGGWGGVGGNGGNDTKGNRVDRMTACIAYLDGVLPSVVMGRGYYGRTVLAAWDWRGGKLTQRWVFDTDTPGNQAYAGQGAHGISVGDVDEDGRDEIVFGAMTVDDNGKGLYSTGFRHGDALHLGDLDPARPGLEVYMIHENEGNAMSSPGADLHSARTGEVYFKTAVGQDVGRGVAADINPDKLGAEFWGTPAGVLDVKGQPAGGPTPSSSNFVIWWDGDLTRELLDGTTISKAGGGSLLTASGASSNNGSKSTPALTADIFGDWREEVIFRAGTAELRIYTTTSPTTTRIHTLMHDPVYRLAVAWQNVAYNQPPHTSFYLGNGMTPPPRPNIYTDQGISISVKRAGAPSSRSGRGFELVRGNAFLPGAYGAAGGTLTLRDLSGRLRLRVQPGAGLPQGGSSLSQGVHVMGQ